VSPPTRRSRYRPLTQGIIPRTFSHILSVVDEGKDKKQYLIRVSFIEIYNEQIHDLLSNDPKEKMEMKEDPKKGVYIKDLTIKTVNNIKQMIQIMETGNNNKSTGATAMNAESSRSHSVFTIYIESSQETDGANNFKNAKLNLVDLAGSERQDKTQATGERLKEAQKINLSLSALGNVIQALVDGKSKHIPYRDSKLTRILQDSLGGNTKTLMIAAVSPASDNFDETMSTLRYASRAKLIKNKPIVNQDPKDAMLAQYAEEIKKLRELLKNKGGQGLAVDGAIREEDMANLERLKEMEDKNREMEEEMVNRRKKVQDREAALR
jgi:kinesin family protein 3/17